MPNVRSFASAAAFDDGDNDPIKVSAKVHFIPVEFNLPEDVRETLSIVQLRQTEGNKVLRFFTPPQNGDLIEWRGHDWLVTCYRHRPLKKGARGQDLLPNIQTQYWGEIASETQQEEE